MVETLAVPEHDRFQIITEHGAEGLVYDPSYLGINRTDDVVLVQITLSAGRKPKQKRDFFARAAELLAQDPGLKPRNLAQPRRSRLGELVLRRRQVTVYGVTALLCDGGTQH